MFRPRKVIIRKTSEHSKRYKNYKSQKWDLIFTNYISYFPYSLRRKLKLVPDRWKPDEAICQPGPRGNQVALSFCDVQQTVWRFQFSRGGASYWVKAELCLASFPQRLLLGKSRVRILSSKTDQPDWRFFFPYSSSGPPGKFWNITSWS